MFSKKGIVLLLATILLLNKVTFSQRDTIRLSLLQTEKIFLDSNLLLVASGFNVEANKITNPATAKTAPMQALNTKTTASHC